MNSYENSLPFCKGVAAKKASKILYKSLKNVVTPCTSMAVQFGIPDISAIEASSGSVSIYLKNVVKVTQDLVSYDILR